MSAAHSAPVAVYAQHTGSMTQISRADWHVTPLSRELWERGGRVAYQEGIDTENASFASAAPDWETFVAHKIAPYCLAAVDDASGDCLAVAWGIHAFARPIYLGVVEHSLYVRSSARGRGVGKGLLGEFIRRTEAGGTWTLLGLVFPENTASIALHESLGFRQVGVYERVGKMPFGARKGQWRDVLLLERRSPIVS